MIILLGLVLLLAIFSLIYLSPNQNISKMTSFINPFNQKTINLTEEQLNSGESVTLENETYLNLNIGDKDYIVGAYKPQNNTIIELIVNNKTYILNSLDERKIDLDNDGFYELSITPENKSSIVLQTTKEKINIRDKFISGMSNQFSDSTLILLIFLVLILTLITLAYIIVGRYLKGIFVKRKISERKDPKDIFNELAEEIKASNGKKAKDLYQKMKNFYNYMDEDEKKKFKPKLISLERYIK